MVSLSNHPLTHFLCGEGPLLRAQGAFFLPGEIHQTLNVTGERALVVRLESQKLDTLTRYQYDTEANTVKIMDR